MSTLCTPDGPARRGDLHEVQRLLELKMDPNETCEPHGTSAVHQAAIGGHCEVLQLLQNFGADLTSQDGRMLSAAHLAADAGHVEVLRLLHELQLPLLMPDGSGKTALHRAAAAGHVQILKFFQDLDVDLLAPAENGKTSVHYAAQAGQNAVLRFLPPSCSTKVLHLSESILRQAATVGM
eukprot:symbB.v1.2.011856.t1/scaffold807.1/size160841/1